MKYAGFKGRESFLKSVFPKGIPLLWCPPLTHYSRDGDLDAARIAAQLKHLSPYVRGFLIPGSTGDGWELTAKERRRLLKLALDEAQKLNVQVLIGALHPDCKEAVRLIGEDVEWIKSTWNEPDAATAFVRAHVCGFTVCAQRGQLLSQEEIGQSLAAILESGYPTAIYQLPQVTLNEISPRLVADLAVRYENFIFFKDTSGSDAVARSREDLKGVFMVRGAEGDYFHWLKHAGGPYDGFLLSSANCFARELHRVVEDLPSGRSEAARQLSERVSNVIREVFQLAGALAYGNPFANGNKAIDHYFAFGPRAVDMPPPRLHAGVSLSEELIKSTGQILSREQLMPKNGYLS